MAGGVSDWVVPSQGPERAVHEGGLAVRQMCSRGGASSDLEADCAVDARRPYLAVERSARISFRLVRSA